MHIRKWFTALSAVITAAFALAILSAPAAKAQNAFGCAFGGFGTQFSGPEVIGIGTTGQLAGASFGCDVAVQKIVIGGEVSYAWVFGDANDLLGIDNDLTIMGRLGYMLTLTIMPYIHADWARASGGGGHVDGTKYGAGLEFKLGDSPLWVDARYSHGLWDEVGPGVDVTSDEFRLGLKVKLWSGESIIPKVAPLK